MTQLVCAVTGANGYIGKQIVNALRHQGCIVYELGRFLKNAQNPQYFLSYQLDQLELPDLKNCDALIHCAYDFDVKTLKKSKEINVDGSVRLFQHAQSCGVKKIILISSLSAFEGARSIYGKTKLALEKQAAQYGAIIIRPGLVFGANTRGIVGAMKKFVKKFPIVPLIGMGGQKFYACYIENLCELIIFLITSNTLLQNPMIAAHKQPITFREIVLLLAKSENKNIRMLPIPFLIILAGLKILEAANINIGLRSDSLVGAQYYDKNPDFSGLDTPVTFPPFQSELI